MPPNAAELSLSSLSRETAVFVTRILYFPLAERAPDARAGSAFTSAQVKGESAAAVPVSPPASLDWRGRYESHEY